MFAAADHPQVFRVRVDLDRARPPIWRRLEMRSDLTLDRVHEVLQTVFGWTDTHLHRFSIGGDPFDRESEQFLCAFDVEEAEADETGVPEVDARLDQTLEQPGDVLHYVYDYGDSWEISIRLERVSPATASTSAAVCTGGRQAAPAEDSGGGYLDDEGAPDGMPFDAAQINEALRSLS